QSQGKGEAWYVNPKDSRRYFLNRPEDATQVMRKLGVGITNKNLAKIPRGETKDKVGSQAVVDKLRGRIVIQVQSKGEAWYISPVDGKRYYMGRPEDALKLIRKLGMGISNTNLNKISIGLTQ
ncbi:MAG TPA: hypothetical protein VJC11_01940, partial [Patescibacteria group bacterium]|nr:hypothetical protein [Patescibacteria group bacterium]